MDRLGAPPWGPPGLMWNRVAFHSKPRHWLRRPLSSTDWVYPARGRPLNSTETTTFCGRHKNHPLCGRTASASTKDHTFCGGKTQNGPGGWPQEEITSTKTRAFCGNDTGCGCAARFSHKKAPLLWNGRGEERSSTKHNSFCGGGPALHRMRTQFCVVEAPPNATSSFVVEGRCLPQKGGNGVGEGLFEPMKRG